MRTVLMASALLWSPCSAMFTPALGPAPSAVVQGHPVDAIARTDGTLWWTLQRAEGLYGVAMRDHRFIGTPAPQPGLVATDASDVLHALRIEGDQLHTRRWEGDGWGEPDIAHPCDPRDRLGTLESFGRHDGRWSAVVRGPEDAVDLWQQTGAGCWEPADALPDLATRFTGGSLFLRDGDTVLRHEGSVWTPSRSVPLPTPHWADPLGRPALDSVDRALSTEQVSRVRRERHRLSKWRLRVFDGQALEMRIARREGGSITYVRPVGIDPPRRDHFSAGPDASRPRIAMTDLGPMVAWVELDVRRATLLTPTGRRWQHDQLRAPVYAVPPARQPILVAGPQGVAMAWPEAGTVALSTLDGRWHHVFMPGGRLEDLAMDEAGRLHALHASSGLHRLRRLEGRTWTTAVPVPVHGPAPSLATVDDEPVVLWADGALVVTRATTGWTEEVVGPAAALIDVVVHDDRIVTLVRNEGLEVFEETASGWARHPLPPHDGVAALGLDLQGWVVAMAVGGVPHILARDDGWKDRTLDLNRVVHLSLTQRGPLCVAAATLEDWGQQTHVVCP